MNYYVRGDDGVETNSGDSDAAAHDLSVADLIVVGTGATSVTGGFLGMTNRAINIQVAGNSEIRIISGVTDTNTITLSAAPSAGNGTYSAKVGGARAAINRVVNSGANNNAALAAADTVYVRPKTGGYNELVVYNVACAVVSLGGEVTNDGTGLGAGSDPMEAAANVFLAGFYVTGAVDIGYSRTAGIPNYDHCRVASPGTDGFGSGVASRHDRCEAKGGTRGFAPSATGIVDGCLVSGASSIGIVNCSTVEDTTIYECATGLSVGSSGTRRYTGNSFLYCTGDGVDAPTAAVMATGSVFENNVVAFNGGYGCDSSAGVQAARGTYRKNLYYNNTSGNRNWSADDEGYTVASADPLFVAVASDDYRLRPTSPAYNTGLGPAQMYPNLGAIPVINDYPAVADVENGVTYAGGTLTGTLSASSGSMTAIQGIRIF